MQKVKAIRFLAICLLAISIVFTSSNAKAFSLYAKDGLTADLALEMAAGVFAIQDAHWDADEDKGYFDGYIKPTLSLSYDSAHAGTLYGGIGYAATGSYGDDGAWDMWKGNTEEFKSEQLYIGWKSGNMLTLGEDFIDVSFGEQEFQIGDGFLIYDGEFDGQYGAYWTAPHKSFDNTAILRVNAKPVRADFFYLKSDNDYGDTELYGVNVEHINDTLGTIGATYMEVTESNEDGFFDNRKGMNVISLRGQGTPFAGQGLENLFLSAEYVKETDGDRAEKDADAWYAEAGYTLAALPWTPTLSYKYAFFSGDEAGTADDEAFDPMFYGASRGWGTHYMGEIVGEYWLFNSNQKTQMVKLNLQPTDAVSVGAIYYDFDLDEKWDSNFGDDFAKEVNIYCDYAVNDYLWLTAVGAWAEPKDQWAAGGDLKDTKLLEIAAFLYF